MLDKVRIPRVALDAMNAVHDEEVDLINALIAQLDAVVAKTLPADALDAPLAELMEHMRRHFDSEQERMEAAGFPPYPVHKAEHERVLAQASAIAARWHERRDPELLSGYLRQTLPSWLVQHVGTMDAVTAQFLAARGFK